MLQPKFCRTILHRDSNLLDEEQDDETTANLLKSLREAADAWLKDNPKGLD